jgi:hypothetical protein
MKTYQVPYYLETPTQEESAHQILEALVNGDFEIQDTGGVDQHEADQVLKNYIAYLIVSNEEVEVQDQNAIMLMLLGSKSEEVVRNMMEMIRSYDNLMDYMYVGEHRYHIFEDSTDQITERAARVDHMIEVFTQIAKSHPDQNVRIMAFNRVSFDIWRRANLEIDYNEKVDQLNSLRMAIDLEEDPNKKAFLIHRYSESVYSVTDDTERKSLADDYDSHPYGVIQRFVEDPRNLCASLILFDELRYSQDLAHTDLLETNVIGIDVIMDLLEQNKEQLKSETIDEFFKTLIEIIFNRSREEEDIEFVTKVISILAKRAGYLD